MKSYGSNISFYISLFFVNLDLCKPTGFNRLLRYKAADWAKSNERESRLKSFQLYDWGSPQSAAVSGSQLTA